MADKKLGNKLVVGLF